MSNSENGAMFFISTQGKSWIKLLELRFYSKMMSLLETKLCRFKKDFCQAYFVHTYYYVIFIQTVVCRYQLFDDMKCRCQNLFELP